VCLNISTLFPNISKYICRIKLLIFERKYISSIYGPAVDPNGLTRRRSNKEINILRRQRNIVRYIKAQRLA
jgi:hypothetical protein